MHHQSQNNDSRYYPHIPPGNLQSSRHLSSNDGNLPSSYDSSRYQPSSFLQNLTSSTTNTIADLVEPLEHRRSIVASPLPSTYIPSNPSPLSSVNAVNLTQAYGLREQLLNNIQHSINDIDRDLTSFERQPSVSCFSPIIKPNVKSISFSLFYLQ